MAAIQSLGQLATVQRGWSPGMISRGVRMYDSFNYEYATIYKLQPNVRTCVDFLARNIAQLGLHVFRRVSDTDRERLMEHGLARALARPLPAAMKVTRYRLIESLLSDLGIYFNAYWLKIRQDGALHLLRLPPVYVTPEGGLVASYYQLELGGRRYELPVEDVVHFRGYNPENPIAGLSPLETLRRTLAEEHAAGQYREGFWMNAARMSGVVQRPAGAPEWSEAARERFKMEFEELYAGHKNSGKTAVLEEGMEWVNTTFNAQESEYLAGRKLTREECARAYHIPLPLVGILDHATFSNVKEQHKHLYQDSLGPWLRMIQEDIELQLLPEFDDTDRVYVEFNIEEKLRGSFEEQVQGLQASVGRPWMTANEARARLNLPSLDGDADQLVTPLNVLIGGQASPRDSAPEQRGLAAAGQKFARKRVGSHAPELRRRHEEQWTAVLTRHYRRQEAAISSRLPKAAKSDIGGVWWDDARWNDELATDLFRLNALTAGAWAAQLMQQAGIDEFSEDAMLPWLEEHSRVQAENINTYTRDQVAAGLRDPEPAEAVKNVFNLALTVWAVRQAVSGVTTAANFGATEAANAGGLRQKTWIVNSSNPRAEHAAMNGETVGIREKFSNGMRWPGDPAGGAENNANCLCSVEFS